MEIVIDESYFFRKSVSRLSGSFASFWQAYLKMKTGLKFFFFLLIFFFYFRKPGGMLLNLWDMLFSAGCNACVSK